MQRGVALDEIGHFLRLILNNIVHSTMDQSGLDLAASLRTETFRDLWN
jgi:hypothetical protein